MRNIRMLFSAVVGSVSAAMLFGLIWVALFLMKAPLSDWPMGWLLAAVALLGGVLGVFKEIADQRRTEANRALAAELKLSYTENSRDLGWPPQLVARVQQGKPYDWRQIWQGEYSGAPLEVVDIHYSVDTGDGSSNRRHTTYVWDLADPSFPSFSVTPRMRGLMIAAPHLLGSTEGLLGFRADNLPPDDAKAVRDFNRTFAVVNRSSLSDEAAIRRIFTPPVMTALTNDKLCATASGGRIAFWQDGVITAGERRLRVIEKTRLLVDRIQSGRNVESAIPVAPDPRVGSQASWDLLPYGCAVGAAMCGFFIGAIAFAFISPRWKLDIPVMPVIVFGSAIAFGILGLLFGKLVAAWRD
jgi:hypothetical protein